MSRPSAMRGLAPACPGSGEGRRAVGNEQEASRDRPEAGKPPRHHDTHGLLPLALQAYLVVFLHRFHTGQQRAHRRQQLAAVERATPEFEVHFHVLRDRGGGSEAADVLGSGVNRGDPFLAVGEIAQRLHAAGRGAGTDGDEKFAVVTDALDALDVLRRGNAPLDEGNIRRHLGLDRSGFGEMYDVHQLRERQQVFAQIQKRQLAAVARREFVNRNSRFHAHQNPLTPKSALTSGYENTGPSLHTNLPPYWQWPQSPTAQCMLRSMLK